MSHRKRVRAYWNRIARAKRTAEILSSLPQLFKSIFTTSAYPRDLVYRGPSLLGINPDRKR